MVVFPSHLLSDTDAGFEQFRVAEKAHGNWMKLYLEGNTSEVLSNMGKKVLKQYLEALAAMSSALSKQLGKYDMYSMIAGMVFVFQVIEKSHLARFNAAAANFKWLKVKEDFIMYCILQSY